jgi:ribosomal protein L37E
MQMPTTPFAPYPVFSPSLALREKSWDDGPSPVPGASGDPAMGRDGKAPRLVCAQCGQPITAEHWRMAVAGAHCHVFANPHGQVFEIGCFSSAPGCAAMGPATPDFSWFSGTIWQIAVCASCGLHLGWRYIRDDGGAFYGLILDRLRQQAGNSD